MYGTHAHAHTRTSAHTHYAHTYTLCTHIHASSLAIGLLTLSRAIGGAKFLDALCLLSLWLLVDTLASLSTSL